MDDLIQQGANAFKSGDHTTARKLLIEAVKQYPNNERAWGWMYNVCSNDKERIHCLKQMLRINPKNEKASQLLNKLANEDFPLESPRTSVSTVQAKNNKSNGLKRNFLIATIIIFSVVLVVLVAVVFSSGFFKSIVNVNAVFSPCNDEVLRKTMDIIISPNVNIEFIGTMPFKHPKEGSLSWRIYERSTYGCVVESSAEVNGERMVGTVWFVDLQQKKVYPDNPWAIGFIQELFRLSGDYNLTQGFPLP